MSQSGLEATFDRWWCALAPGAPEPEREYRFHPERRWRFDRAWPGPLVAVELEGGTWIQGRHTRGAGFRADCEKYNEAIRLGWRVLRFTAGMLEDDPAGVVEMVREQIEMMTIHVLSPWYQWPEEVPDDDP